MRIIKMLEEEGGEEELIKQGSCQPWQLKRSGVLQKRAHARSLSSVLTDDDLYWYTIDSWTWCLGGQTATLAGSALCRLVGWGGPAARAGRRWAGAGRQPRVLGTILR